MSTSNYSGFGGDAYGSVPAAISPPPSTYQQLMDIVPRAAGLAGQDASLIGQQMSGVMPADVTNQVKNYGAMWGVGSGMPGSGMSQNLTLTDLGLTSMQEQQTGQSNYLNFISGLGSQMNSPEMLTGIAENNATMAAAPNPTAAANNEQSLIEQYMKAMNPASSNSSWFTPAGADDNVHLPMPKY